MVCKSDKSHHAGIEIRQMWGITVAEFIKIPVIAGGTAWTQEIPWETIIETILPGWLSPEKYDNSSLGMLNYKKWKIISLKKKTS